MMTYEEMIKEAKTALKYYQRDGQIALHPDLASHLGVSQVGTELKFVVLENFLKEADGAYTPCHYCGYAGHGETFASEGWERCGECLAL